MVRGLCPKQPTSSRHQAPNARTFRPFAYHIPLTPFFPCLVSPPRNQMNSPNPRVRPDPLPSAAEPAGEDAPVQVVCADRGGGEVAHRIGGAPPRDAARSEVHELPRVRGATMKEGVCCCVFSSQWSPCVPAPFLGEGPTTIRILQVHATHT